MREMMTMAALAAMSVAGTVHAGVNFISTEWAAGGNGRLVESGFPDLTGTVALTGDSAFSDYVMRLNNHPGQPPIGIPVYEQSLRVRITDEIGMGGGEFGLSSQPLAHIDGPGTGVDAQSVVTSRAVFEVTGDPQRFSYTVQALRNGFTMPLTTGTDHRASRLTLAPLGGSPLLDIFRESTYTTTSSATDEIVLTPGVYEVSLDIRFEVLQMDVLGNVGGSPSAVLEWRGVPAPGSLVVVGAGLLGATRRRRAG